MASYALSPVVDHLHRWHIPSAYPEITQHDKDDDDGTHEPSDSVHEGFPLLARVGKQRGKPTHIGLIPRDPIQAFSGNVPCAAERRGPMSIAEGPSGQTLNVDQRLTAPAEQPLELVATKHLTLQ